MAQHKKSMASLESQIKNAKCTFWQAIFSFGRHCRAVADLKQRLAVLLVEHAEDFSIAKSM